MYTAFLGLFLNNEGLFKLFEIIVDIYLFVLSLSAWQLLHSLWLQGHAKNYGGVIGCVNHFRTD